VNQFNINDILLTSPKVLSDSSIRFATVSLTDEFDIAFISMRARPFLSGRRYQSIMYDTSPIFLHCRIVFFFFYYVKSIYFYINKNWFLNCRYISNFITFVNHCKNINISNTLRSCICKIYQKCRNALKMRTIPGQ